MSEITRALRLPTDKKEIDELFDRYVEEKVQVEREKYSEALMHEDDQERLRAVRSESYGTMDSGRSRQISKLRRLDEHEAKVRPGIEKTEAAAKEKYLDGMAAAEKAAGQGRDSIALAHYVVASGVKKKSQFNDLRANEAITQTYASELLVEEKKHGEPSKEQEAKFLSSLSLYSEKLSDEHRQAARNRDKDSDALSPRMDRSTRDYYVNQYKEEKTKSLVAADDASALAKRTDKLLSRPELAQTSAAKQYFARKQCREELSAVLGRENVTVKLVDARMNMQEKQSSENIKAYNKELSECAKRSLVESISADKKQKDAHRKTADATLKADLMAAQRELKDEKAAITAQFKKKQESKSFWPRLIEKVTGKDRKIYDSAMEKAEKKYEQKVIALKQGHQQSIKKTFESKRTQDIENVISAAEKNKSFDPIPKIVTPGEGQQPHHKAAPDKVGSYTRQPDGAYAAKDGRVAFIDKGNAMDLTPARTAPDVNMSVKAFAEKNWRSIDVSNVSKSDPEMARKIAIEATARNMEVKGHKMSPDDQQAASSRRAALEQTGSVRRDNEAAREAQQYSQQQTAGYSR